MFHLRKYLCLKMNEIMENMYVSEQRSLIHITYWVDDRGSFPLGRSGLNKREANMILPDG